MLVEYEGTEYDFNIDEITLKQAKAIKDSCGMTLRGLEIGVDQGDPDALRAVFWLMQVSSGVKSNIDDVDFKIVKFSKAIDLAVQKQAEAEEAEKAAEKKASRSKSKKVATVDAAPELV